MLVVGLDPDVFVDEDRTEVERRSDCPRSVTEFDARLYLEVTLLFGGGEVVLAL